MGSRGMVQIPVASAKGKTLKTVIQVTGEEKKDVNDIAHLTLSGIKLENKDGWFGKSDPFYNLSRSNRDGTFSKVWQSEVVMDNLNPKWKPASVPVG